MIKEIHCLLKNEPVCCFESDGSKHVKAKTASGEVVREKACNFISFSKREYSFKFSRKLLNKLTINEDFWND